MSDNDDGQQGGFPIVLQWYYVPYMFSDPTRRISGQAWMEFGLPEKITCKQHVETVIYHIRQARHSPETNITPLNFVYMREAPAGEPERKLMGNLPPPVN